MLTIVSRGLACCWSRFLAYPRYEHSSRTRNLSRIANMNVKVIGAGHGRTGKRPATTHDATDAGLWILCDGRPPLILLDFARPAVQLSFVCVVVACSGFRYWCVCVYLRWWMFQA